MLPLPFLPVFKIWTAIRAGKYNANDFNGHFVDGAVLGQLLLPSLLIKVRHQNWFKSYPQQQHIPALMIIPSHLKIFFCSKLYARFFLPTSPFSIRVFAPRYLCIRECISYLPFSTHSYFPINKREACVPMHAFKVQNPDKNPEPPLKQEAHSTKWIMSTHRYKSIFIRSP